MNESKTCQKAQTKQVGDAKIDFTQRKKGFCMLLKPSMEDFFVIFCIS